MKTLGGIFLYLLLCFLTTFAELPEVNNQYEIDTLNQDTPVVAFQVIISEIMADPNPCIMLPDAEYLELFNNSASTINLLNWHLVFGNHERILPSATLDPGNYIIVCDSREKNAFSGYGKTLPLENMPVIVNDGQTLTLKSPVGTVIHSVTYSPDWYKNQDKSEGGWSLEIIDPSNPCGSDENWSESYDFHGGTPGSENSVNTNNPDIVPPFILRATLSSDSSVLLHFNEYMDSASISSRWSYSANNDLLHPVEANPIGPAYNCINLIYPETFDSIKTYTMVVQNSLKDCAGNSISNSTSALFTIPCVPAYFDLVINELLFNPATGMSEFIELYNRSSKVLDLADFSLGLLDPITGESIHTNPLSDYHFLLFPAHYVVLTDDPNSLPNNAFLLYPSAIVRNNDLFSLPNEEGAIALLCNGTQFVDMFKYNQSMHDELLITTKGVSLERINASNPTNDPENWHSASTSVGYSTPGHQNSQMSSSDNIAEEITLLPEVFSPDHDGQDDFVTLHLRLHEPGWIANIVLFDVNGNKIKDLISNALLGTDEYFTWDGTLSNNQTASAGIYIFYFEIFNEKGNLKKFKKVVTLTRQL